MWIILECLCVGAADILKSFSTEVRVFHLSMYHYYSFAFKQRIPSQIASMRSWWRRENILDPWKTFVIKRRGINYINILLRLTHLYIKGVFLLGFNTLLFFDGASLKSKVTRAIYPFLFDSKGTGKIFKIAAFEHYCEKFAKRSASPLHIGGDGHIW